jgi:hypothetical protein
MNRATVWNIKSAGAVNRGSRSTLRMRLYAEALPARRNPDCRVSAYNAIKCTG